MSQYVVKTQSLFHSFLLYLHSFLRDLSRLRKILCPRKVSPYQSSRNIGCHTVYSIKQNAMCFDAVLLDIGLLMWSVAFSFCFYSCYYSVFSHNVRRFHIRFRARLQIVLKGDSATGFCRIFNSAVIIVWFLRVLLLLMDYVVMVIRHRGTK